MARTRAFSRSVSSVAGRLCRSAPDVLDSRRVRERAAGGQGPVRNFCDAPYAALVTDSAPPRHRPPRSLRLAGGMTLAFLSAYFRRTLKRRSMSLMAESYAMTAEQLLQLPSGRWRYELVEGALRQMTPAGRAHGRIAARVGTSLGAFVDRHHLGETYAAETGFVLRRAPDTVRAPDASFVSADRLGALAPSAEGYLEGAPDLAVEVLSPSDQPRDVRRKVADWLSAGCRAVVVLDPRRGSALVYRSDRPVQTLAAGAELSVPDVVPGWSVRVSDLFG